MSDEVRMHALERAVQEIKDAIGQIADAMVAIARLEERHQETRESLGRAFDRIEAVEKKQGATDVVIERINGQIEPLKETRRWVIGGVLAVTGMVGVAVVGLVLVK